MTTPVWVPAALVRCCALAITASAIDAVFRKSRRFVCFVSISLLLFLYDVEVHHHAGGVMFEDVTVRHPRSRTIVRQPRDLYAAHRRHVDGVFPGSILRRCAIYG